MKMLPGELHRKLGQWSKVKERKGKERKGEGADLGEACPFLWVGRNKLGKRKGDNGEKGKIVRKKRKRWGK